MSLPVLPLLILILINLGTAEMTEQIRDFETENLISHFKFTLTNWTLN